MKLVTSLLVALLLWPYLGAASTLDSPDLARTTSSSTGTGSVLEMEQRADDDWLLRDNERIAVDPILINQPWQPVPFATSFFDLPEEQLEQAWPRLMRGLLVPYPSAEYLQLRLQHFPELLEELGPHFDGDYQRLSQEVLHTWRLFFRGDFRAAKEHGMRLGVYGKIPGYFAQIIQAIYLADSNTEKHQMLQDAADQVASYAKVLKAMEGDSRFEEDYMMLRLGYAYAIGRIAEDVPIMVALARNYLFKVLGAVNDVLDIRGDHPVGLAFRAGIDANLIRVVGKAVGRLTFGARQTRVQGYFEDSFEAVDDMAIVHYEYANALLYINKGRDEEEVMEHLTKARNMQPNFAMEALDSMYADKRSHEVHDFLRYGRSFRAYERRRKAYVSETDENLHNVLKPPFLLITEGS